MRSGLIVLQFAISMILISGAVIIYRQLEFIQSKNLGFDREQVLVIPLKEKRVVKRIQELKTELLKIDGVKSVSASSNLPGGQFNQNSISLDEQPDQKVTCSEAFVDFDFLKTMDIELADGRFFAPENLTDSYASFVINEIAARQLQSSSVVGREIRWHAYENDNFVKGRVIGVVKDFHYQSLHQSIQPLVLVLYPAYNHLVIKLNPDDFESKIAQVKNVYNQFDEIYDFEFSFLDERLNQQYKSEQHAGTVFGIFAFLAVAIACFGLFGMAIITFNQRIKEVSVHKIMGASVLNLIRLLLGDFTKLISIAILLAAPLAWWIMTNWLNNFTYRVNIHPAIFLLSGFSLLIIAWITLSYFTIKTSRINPAETLRSE
jgi:putative ABC transport system permease protein